jgi:hypothetical protein
MFLKIGGRTLTARFGRYEPALNWKSDLAGAIHHARNGMSIVPAKTF